MVSFKHPYTKLNYPIFTTIRSVDYMKKNNLNIGSIDSVIVEGINKGNAILIGYYDSPINDMPFELLKYDTSPLVCNTYDDFIKILNSFIQFPSNQLTTIKRITFWMWLHRG